MIEPLTASEAEVARLYRAGWQVETIAQRFGCSPRTIHQHAYRIRKKGHDLARNHGGGPARKVDFFVYARMARDGKPQTQIARECGVCVSTVSRSLSKLREDGATVPRLRGGQEPRWDRDSVEALAELALQVGMREAGARHGVSKGRVSNLFCQYGIKLTEYRQRSGRDGRGCAENGGNPPFPAREGGAAALVGSPR